jgi:hypothetical protein
MNMSWLCVLMIYVNIVCSKVCRLSVTVWWFPLISIIIRTDHHDMIDLLLKVP